MVTKKNHVLSVIMKKPRLEYSLRNCCQTMWTIFGYNKNEKQGRNSQLSQIKLDTNLVKRTIHQLKQKIEQTITHILLFDFNPATQK